MPLKLICHPLALLASTMLNLQSELVGHRDQTLQAMDPWWCIATALLSLLLSATAMEQRGAKKEAFITELFLNDDELNSGLYEGMVIGRRKFGRSQVPHGTGSIYYFTNDKFHRLNFTGSWINGTRNGNGKTHFKDGSVYEGDYKDGVEDGEGTIRYANGNVLVGEFRKGKIHGHAVFKYPNGNQREGFFRENILDGQVIFTEDSGRTVIEVWRNGQRVDDETQEVIEATTTPTTTAAADESVDSESSAEAAVTELAPTVSTSDSLELLRKAIRNGDKTRSFFFNDGSRTPKAQDNEPDPKEGDQDKFVALREESAKEDKDFLRQVFNQVHQK